MDLRVMVHDFMCDPAELIVEEGAQVVFLLLFDDGYTLSVSALTSGGTAVPYTIETHGVCRIEFTMPASDVTITLTTTAAAATDLNHDGVTNIGDVTALLNYLAGAAASDLLYDLDNNGNVNISDVTALLNALASA